MAHRDESCSTAVARNDLSLRSHSILTEPDPAPKSHKCWPYFGANAERVNALIGLFVI